MSFAVLCPGQGRQHAGMLDLFATVPDGAAALRRARDAAMQAAGFDLLAATSSGAPDAFSNAVAQPLICASQWIAWSALGPRLATAGVRPRLFAGYSVGELGAYGCNGALSCEDLLLLAARRATAMDAASIDGDGLVALRGWTRGAVDAACAAHGAAVAIVNGDDHFIVGGHADAMVAVTRAAAADGATASRLPVGVAAHTPLLAPAADAFRDDLIAARWQTGFVPVFAGVDGALVRDPSRATDVLARQVAATIRWSACLDGLQERGATVCLELGPGDALSRMLRDRHPEIAVRSVADFRSAAAVVDWVVRALG